MDRLWSQLSWRTHKQVLHHLTVPPRYLELSMLRQGMNIRGKFGEVALATRDVYMERYYPEIVDNDWRIQSSQIETQTNFAEFLIAKRLELIQHQEEADKGKTTCPIFTWTWSDVTEGPMPFPRSMILLPRTQRLGLRLEPHRQCSYISRRSVPSLDTGHWQRAEVHEHRGPGPLRVPDVPSSERREKR